MSQLFSNRDHVRPEALACVPRTRLKRPMPSPCKLFKAIEPANAYKNIEDASGAAPAFTSARESGQGKYNLYVTARDVSLPTRFTPMGRWQLALAT